MDNSKVSYPSVCYPTTSIIVQTLARLYRSSHQGHHMIVPWLIQRILYSAAARVVISSGEALELHTTKARITREGFVLHSLAFPCRSRSDSCNCLRFLDEDFFFLHLSSRCRWHRCCHVNHHQIVHLQYQLLWRHYQLVDWIQRGLSISHRRCLDLSKELLSSFLKHFVGLICLSAENKS